MADSTDKPKEKKKKKSIGSTKEKEKKTSETSTGSEANKSEKQGEQTGLKAEKNVEEIKSTAKAQPDKVKKELKVSKEPSATENSIHHEQNVPHAAELQTALQNKRNEPEPIPLDISDKPLVKPNYKAPPSSTKKDVDLLKDLDESKLEELREAFELFDLDQDGIISKNDLKLTFATLGQTDISEKEIMQMLSETIGPLDFESFVILLGYKTIELDPEAILIDALSRWDYDNSGLISEERIKHDLMTWGDKFTPEEVDMALDDAPVCMLKGAAMIDYIKFCNTLSGLRKKTKMPVPEDFMSKGH